MPTIKEISSLLISLKSCIDQDSRATCEPDDTLPGINVIIATDGNEWTYQTGDPQYSGSAYFYPYWSQCQLYRRSNCYDIAREIVNDLKDQVSITIE